MTNKKKRADGQMTAMLRSPSDQIKTTRVYLRVGVHRATGLPAGAGGHLGPPVGAARHLAHHRADVAAALASLIVRKHGERLASWDVGRVVPVPMHWLRRSIRGTSAADELSRRIARLLGLPHSPTLSRHRATRMQNELPIADRPRNVLGAFRSRRRLDGERILLVDDVVTTGATLSACCRALLAAGAVTVDVAVVAKADRNTADDA
jgi:predicted amidophosphoribosyltransferase